MSGHGDGGHGHAHGPPHDSHKGPLFLALALTAGFSVAEVVVGFWSGSLALLADAGHMVGDSLALALSLVIAVIAARPRSREKTYGYRRAEVLGATVNGAALIAIALFIVLEGLGRLASPPEVRAEGMLLTASLGLVVNGVVAAVLVRSAKSSINVRAALFHVLGDALGSVAAIIAGLLMWFWDLRLADPIASIAIATLIFVGAIRLLRETTHVLMEGAPQGIDLAAVERTIADTEGVASVHDLHCWSITPGDPILTAHVVLLAGHHGVEVAREVGRRLNEAFRFHHVTIQPEAPALLLVALRIPSDAND